MRGDPAQGSRHSGTDQIYRHPSREHRVVQFDAVKDGSRCHIERLRDLWADGVHADVLYPTAGLSLLQLDDASFQAACLRVCTGGP